MKKQPEKFNKKLNMDTATEAKIQKTNEELVKYLEDKGEDVAVERIKHLIKNQAKVVKKEEPKNKLDEKLLKVNSEILTTLRKIEQNMIDEQDTSIKPKGGGVALGGAKTKFNAAPIVKSEKNDTSLGTMSLIALSIAALLYNDDTRQGAAAGLWEGLKNMFKDKKPTTEPKPKPKPTTKPTAKARVAGLAKDVKEGAAKVSENIGKTKSVVKNGLKTTVSKAATPAAVALAAYEGYSDYKEADKDYIDGKISAEEALEKKTGAVIENTTEVVGALAGAQAGAVTGAMIGAMVGPLGVVVGGFIGGVIGGVTGSMAGSEVGTALSKGVSKEFNTDEQDELLDRLDKEGIIEHNGWFRKSKILKLEEIQSMHAYEIKALIDTDDWMQKDLSHLEIALQKALKREGMKGKSKEEIKKYLIEKSHAHQVEIGDVLPVVASSSTFEGTPVSQSGSALKAREFFVSKGWTPEQASGIVGNLMVESGLKTDQTGDKGRAYGIAQWHPDRQEDFKRMYNKDIREASFEEQLAFVDWELNNSEAGAGKKLKATKSYSDAALAVSAYYERPNKKYAHNDNRVMHAEAVFNSTGPTAEEYAEAGQSIVDLVNNGFDLSSVYDGSIFLDSSDDEMENTSPETAKQDQMKIKDAKVITDNDNIATNSQKTGVESNKNPKENQVFSTNNSLVNNTINYDAKVKTDKATSELASIVNNINSYEKGLDDDIRILNSFLS